MQISQKLHDEKHKLWRKPGQGICTLCAIYCTPKRLKGEIEVKVYPLYKDEAKEIISNQRYATENNPDPYETKYDMVIDSLNGELAID